ncbi:hypothetical protein G3A39_39720 [Paraburkholderia aspalathi]|nr:hypothetical protein [Paraburkholderia aspalathi]
MIGGNAYARNTPSARLDRGIATLINAIDSKDFLRLYIQFFRDFISFDMAMITVYDHDNIVAHFFDTFPQGTSDLALRKYTESTFRFSPFFQYHRLGIKNGVYLMEKLAKGAVLKRPVDDTNELEIDASEEVGYATFGWPKGLKELDIAVRLSATKTAQIALYRLGADTFSEKEIEYLSSLQQTITTIFLKYWNIYGNSLANYNDPIDRALNSMGGERLTNRERQILKLVIRGMPSELIAKQLDIGRETVKSHRKNAYQKIDISSQVELLARMLDHMTGIG